MATFTESLLGALARIRGGTSDSGVIRLVPGWDGSVSPGPEVVAELDVTATDWVSPIESWCRDFDLLWIQHEFGIFGPNDGVSALELCSRSPLPIAVTLHTVMAAPTSRQRRILEALSQAAEVVVVMSEQAKRRLAERFGVDRDKVQVVPHGAQFPARTRHEAVRNRQPTIVNWGLIGPGKGLETGIRAMSLLQHLEPAPRLVIRGTTHPNVKRRQGDAYRDGLLRLVEEIGLSDSVEIRDGYMTALELEALVQSADLALLPYDTTEQVTSGVLVDAIGAGVPVVATAFPHAIELLSTGAGRVVPQRNPEAMAAAVEGLLTDPSALKMATEEARRIGHYFAWPRVALRYQQLARRVLEKAGNEGRLTILSLLPAGRQSACTQRAPMRKNDQQSAPGAAIDI